MHEQIRLGEGGDDPQQQLRVIGGVRRPGRVPAGGLGQLAAHLAVQRSHPPGHHIRPRPLAVGDRLQHLGGPPQPGVRIVERTGLCEEALEGHGVGRHQQQRPRAAETDQPLTVNLAEDRLVGEVGGAGHTLKIPHTNC